MTRFATALGAAALAFMTTSAQAQRVERVKAGLLECDVSAGIGFIIGSQKEVQCLFTPDLPGPQEIYVGMISKFGLDIGVTAGGRLVWSVYAPTTRGFGALSGIYEGATGEATIGLGLGANVLVGGSDRTVALQPLSVTGQAGLNLAVGVASLDLRPAR